jgi:hypothetical protein
MTAAALPAGCRRQSRTPISRNCWARNRSPDSEARRYRRPSRPGPRHAARRRRNCRRNGGAAAALAVLATVLTIVLGNAAVSRRPRSAARQDRHRGRRQPRAAVRNAQYWYIKGWVSYSVCDSGSATSKCAFWKATQTARSGSRYLNDCRTGLLREDGRDARGVLLFHHLHCRVRGGTNDPPTGFVQSHPRPAHLPLMPDQTEMRAVSSPCRRKLTTIGTCCTTSLARGRRSPVPGSRLIPA